MLRSLSQMERGLWMLSQDYQRVVTITVRIRGSFSKDEFRAALSRVNIRHPWLGARISGSHPWGACFVATVAPDFAVRVVDPAGEDAWPEVVAEEYQRPFSYEAGPLVRF